MRSLALPLALALILLAPLVAATGFIQPAARVVLDTNRGAILDLATPGSQADQEVQHPASAPASRPLLPSVPAPLEPVVQDVPSASVPAQMLVAPETQLFYGEPEAMLPRHVESKAARMDRAASSSGYAPRELPLTPVSLPRALPLAQLPYAGVPFFPSAPNAPQQTPRASEPIGTRAAEPAHPTRDDPTWVRGAAVAAGLALVLLAPFLLYHRLRGQELLAHSPRARIAALLRETPGLTPADAARALEIDPSTALYHLRRLVKDGLAVADASAGAPRYFVAGGVAPEARVRVVALREAAPLLAIVREEPGVSKTRLAAKLAIARPTLAWHLRRLQSAGLVRFQRDGRNVRVFAEETLS